MAGHVLPEAKLALCGTSVEFQPPPISLFLGNRDTDSQGRSHGAARLVYQKTPEVQSLNGRRAM